MRFLYCTFNKKKFFAKIIFKKRKKSCEKNHRKGVSFKFINNQPHYFIFTKYIYQLSIENIIKMSYVLISMWILSLKLNKEKRMFINNNMKKQSRTILCVFLYLLIRKLYRIVFWRIRFLFMFMITITIIVSLRILLARPDNLYYFWSFLSFL